MARRTWTLNEDRILLQVIEENGQKDWTLNAKHLRLRCETANNYGRTGKQCRQRWYNHLSPELDKTEWSCQQEAILFQLHKAYGNKWKQISKHFPGRTDSNVKNKFFSILRKSLRRINKFLGKKGSTDEIREIKPSVMTEILNFIYQNENNSNQVSNFQEIPSLLFAFSSFKTNKETKNCQPTNFQKNKIQLILKLVSDFKALHSDSKINENQNICHFQSTEKHSTSIKCIQSNLSEHTQKIRQEPYSNLWPSQSFSPIIIKTNVDGSKTHQEDSKKKIEERIESQNCMSQVFYRCSIKLDDESFFSKSFIPFEEPSVSFNSNLQDLVVIGKHIQPVRAAQWGILKEYDGIENGAMDEIFDQHYSFLE